MPQGGPPPHHSMTSSARASKDCGTVSPRALAVLRLMTSSNFVGCTTGRSPGIAPLRGGLAYRFDLNRSVADQAAIQGVLAKCVKPDGAYLCAASRTKEQWGFALQMLTFLPKADVRSSCQ